LKTDIRAVFRRPFDGRWGGALKAGMVADVSSYGCNGWSTKVTTQVRGSFGASK
jgi:hypothetical protein